ncbi:ATP-binding protein [Virgibacillus sp. CBA3643]|uniref:ATP-binding protein n=1 Tax=Virgibacillus sp. CBA3643 TaxID=2942278 RepID=UPI0035A30CCD
MQSIKEAMKGIAPSMILVREGSCDYCGEDLKTYESEIIGGPDKGKKVRKTYGCRCKNIQLARQNAVNKRKRHARLLKEKFDRYSLINKKLEKATIDNYVPDNESQEFAKEQTQKYIDKFDLEEAGNLSFHGNYGIGKSHLAKGVADGVMEKGYTAIFISVPKLLRKIRSSYSRDSEITEDEIFHMLETVDLLILDDFGVEKESDWSIERIYDLIDSRQGMNTIYTTNYSPAEIIEIKGERDGSRMINEDTVPIQMQGENYRLRDIRAGDEN